mmetsp:Transcript_66874/g.124947  ORF Transcript_66874/g.124947 Transcript_66874/m.124947 type:complete len:206 (-) Transcript_66874:529-1146(-)
MVWQSWYGRTPPKSSIRMQPIAHMSIFSVRLPKVGLKHSGAMYRGEPPSPSCFLVMCVASTPICCARPKSHIFALPEASSKMFIDFRSLWTTFHACRNVSPSAICTAMLNFCVGINGLVAFLPKSRSCKEPPGMNSVRTSNIGGWIQAPMNRTNLGCRRRRSALISFFMASRCVTPLIFLMATSCPFHEPLYTCADPPAPSRGPN